MKFNTLCLIFLLVLSLVLLPVGVSAGEVSLVSGTGTDTAGISLTDTVADPLNAALYSFGTWSSATVTSWGDVITPWYDKNTAPFGGSGAEWISTAAIHENPNDLNEWRLFKQVFSIPIGSTINSALLSYTADNAVAVYLNGIEVASTVSVYGAQPVSTTYTFQSFFGVDLSSYLHNGVNELEFVLRNWQNPVDAANPTGLIYSGTVEYSTPAPEFPTLFVPITMIIGFIGVVFLIQKKKF